MTQHATFPAGYEAKGLGAPSPEYGRHSPGHKSFVSDMYASPYAGASTPANTYASHAVELPVSSSSHQVQELPAYEAPRQASPRYAPSELLSGHSTPQTVTPMASPRFPDEELSGHGGGGGYAYGRSS